MATTILVSSIPGIHQNSNLVSGGGTDDTALIQTILSASYSNGLILIQDGVSLVSGLNVSSNTTIQCNANCGFYLANQSNRAMFRNANRCATIAAITDHDITFIGGTFNGNIANQTFNAFHCESDGTPMSILQFYGIKNFTVTGGALFHNAVYAGVGCGIFQTVDLTNFTVTEDVFSLNTTGVDVRGPASGATISNLILNNIGDDALALNSRNYQNIVNLGPFLLGGNISNVSFSNIFINGGWAGIDLVSDGGFSISNVTMSGISGTVENYALYYNLDLYDAPITAQGSYSNIYWNPNNTISQFGSPFSQGVPAGLLLTGPVPMYSVSTSPVYTNSASAQNSGTNSIAAAFPSHTTGQSYLLAYILVNPGASVNATSVTDSLLNTWVQIASGSTGTSNVYLYRCASNKAGGGANTITAHFSGTTVLAIISIIELGNVKSPFEDAAILAALTTTTSYSAPTITTKNPNELVFGIGFISGVAAITGANGFTLAQQNAHNAVGIYDVVPTAGAYSPSATATSSQWQLFTLGLIGPQTAGNNSSSSWLTTAVVNRLRGLKH